MSAHLWNILVFLMAVATGILASIFLPFDQSFAIFIAIIGTWFLILGLTESEKSTTGIFSSSAVKVWWGGLLASVGIVWILYRNLLYSLRLAIAIFLGILCVILVLASRR